MGDQGAVNCTTTAWDEMKRCWDLDEALFGGTPSMRAAGQIYLPKFAKETDTAWKIRRDRSFLFAKYRDTVCKVSARPFRKPVVVGDELTSVRLAAIYDNADREGTNLTDFARAVLCAAIRRGMTHIYVDRPQAPRDASGRPVIDVDVRPYFVHVEAGDMLPPRFRINPKTGQRELDQIRMKEVRSEAVGDYGVEDVEYIRVVNAPEINESGERVARGTVELWRWSEDAAQFVLAEDPREHEFPGIPLTTIYTNQTGAMMASSPFEDLAHINVAHWQSASDFRNIMAVSSFGILFAASDSIYRQLQGGEEIDDNGNVVQTRSLDTGIAFGVNQVIVGKTGDSLQFVEHSGSAVGSGAEYLQQLKDEMNILGLQIQAQRPDNITATATRIDDSKSMSQAESWVRALENGLLSAYEDAATWIGETLPDDFTIDVVNEPPFGPSTDDVATLIQLWTAGALSLETLMNEIKKRGVLDETIDVAEERERIEQEEQEGRVRDVLSEGIDAVDDDGVADEDQDQEGESGRARDAA